MRRLAVCFALFAICVALSVYSYVRMERMRDGVFLRVDEMLAFLDSRPEDRPENRDELEARAHELAAFWKAERDVVVHIVRRNYLDAITLSAAKLPQLARHGEYGKLAAELSGMRKLAEDLHTGEKLNLENIM
jgi:hypothetical protein